MFELSPFEGRHLGLFERDPFREMENFEKEFFGRGAVSGFRTDITDAGDSYMLEADLPGFDKNDISVEIADGLMTIKAHKGAKNDKKDEKGRYICRERSYGSVSRSFDLAGINPDGITGKYENGVLHVTLPKEEKQAPTTRKIELS